MRLQCFPHKSAHEDMRIGYLQKEASALYQQGDELGDNRALLSAIERYNRLVHLMPRDRVPLRWASAKTIWAMRFWRLDSGKAGRHGCKRPPRLSRGAEGMDSGTRAARLGDDPEQFGPGVLDPRRA